MARIKKTVGDTARELGIDKEQLGRLGESLAQRLINTPDTKFTRIARELLPDWVVDGLFNTIAIGLALQSEVFVLDAVNSIFRENQIDLQLTSLRSEDIKNDMDRFAANYINAKMETRLIGIKKLTKDEVFEELGRVIAIRINSEAGSNISNIFPVKKFREEFSAAVVDQINNTLSDDGAVMTRYGKRELKEKLLKGMTGYAPPPQATSTPESVLASNRLKQKKYRQTHKAVYFTLDKIAEAEALRDGDAAVL
jgi:hypothetical protein